MALEMILDLQESEVYFAGSMLMCTLSLSSEEKAEHNLKSGGSRRVQDSNALGDHDTIDLPDGASQDRPVKEFQLLNPPEESCAQRDDFHEDAGVISSDAREEYHFPDDSEPSADLNRRNSGPLHQRAANEELSPRHVAKTDQKGTPENNPSPRPPSAPMISLCFIQIVGIIRLNMKELNPTHLGYAKYISSQQANTSSRMLPKYLKLVRGVHSNANVNRNGSKKYS